MRDADLNAYQKIITLDGSVTLYNAEFDEPYHSKSGAIEEALEKYVRPTGIIGSSRLVVVDYCFGLGYNALAAMVHAEHLTIYAIENDAYLLYLLSTLTDEVPEQYKPLYVEMATKLRGSLIDAVGCVDEHCSESELIRIFRDFTGTIKLAVGSHTVHFLVGDARHTILEIAPVSVDAIFWDPFSTTKCPELWTAEEFSKAYVILRVGGVLSTYSYARKVREGLSAVGFTVKDGPIIGRRSPSTLAYKE